MKKFVLSMLLMLLFCVQANAQWSFQPHLYDGPPNPSPSGRCVNGQHVSVIWSGAATWHGQPATTHVMAYLEQEQESVSVVENEDGSVTTFQFTQWVSLGHTSIPVFDIGRNPFNGDQFFFDIIGTPLPPVIPNGTRWYRIRFMHWSFNQQTGQVERHPDVFSEPRSFTCAGVLIKPPGVIEP